MSSLTSSFSYTPLATGLSTGQISVPRVCISIIVSQHSRVIKLSKGPSWITNWGDLYQVEISIISTLKRTPHRLTHKQSCPPFAFALGCTCKQQNLLSHQFWPKSSEATNADVVRFKCTYSSFGQNTFLFFSFLIAHIKYLQTFFTYVKRYLKAAKADIICCLSAIYG